MLFYLIIFSFHHIFCNIRRLKQTSNNIVTVILNFFYIYQNTNEIDVLISLSQWYENIPVQVITLSGYGGYSADLPFLLI